jgi:hypothetical protein
MSDPLNPYPGNLRRHIVDNSDLQVLILRTNDMEGLEHVRDIYEAARAKDAELIQRLVDAIMDNARYRLLTEGEEGDTVSDFMNMTLNEALAAADAHGFKPSEG